MEDRNRAVEMGKQVQWSSKKCHLIQFPSFGILYMNTPTTSIGKGNTEKTEPAPESSTIGAIQTAKHPGNMLMSFLMTVAT